IAVEGGLRLAAGPLLAERDEHRRIVPGADALERGLQHHDRIDRPGEIEARQLRPRDRAQALNAYAHRLLPCVPSILRHARAGGDSADGTGSRGAPAPPAGLRARTPRTGRSRPWAAAA